ncbi:MAG TPA: hypothetical protein VES20_12175 [Bryobacteraceae bacterium]|nr:hypothetical protein [Bryobacteraceae bacterium]
MSELARRMIFRWAHGPSHRRPGPAFHLPGMASRTAIIGGDDADGREAYDNGNLPV